MLLWGGWAIARCVARCRHEVWDVIRDVFPSARMRGRPPVDRRTVVEATAWRFRTGSAWRDLPERFGSWNTIYKNFRRWATDGVWEDLFARVQKRASLQGEIDWVVSVDSSIARVHQHGATLSRDTGGSIELQEIRAGAA
ncbi:MAG: transposase [Microbacterium sp.]